jgi:hypothetical protein
MNWHHVRQLSGGGAEQFGGPGGGGGTVVSVTGNIVDNTDPANPIITQKQADWTQADNTKPDFILHKPTIINPPIYPNQRIVVGDGITPGGITVGLLTYNTGGGTFIATDIAGTGIRSNYGSSEWSFGQVGGNTILFYINAGTREIWSGDLSGNKSFYAQLGAELYSMGSKLGTLISIDSPNTTIKAIDSIGGAGFYFYGGSSAGASGSEMGLIVDIPNSSYYLGNLIGNVILVDDSIGNISFGASSSIQISTGLVNIVGSSAQSPLIIKTVNNYATDAAAGAAGLLSGMIYQTVTAGQGVLKIKQ